jgi:hypothetical protein
MPVRVLEASSRRDLIAYLQTSGEKNDGQANSTSGPGGDY